ncbi:MAG TPA: glycosyltransferase, partial [Bacteroidetes bacterium]|nr:glycosyltransferase [Bacteroidota bacterium]
KPLRLARFIKKNAPINSFKKKAIETAIAQASGQLIVTTDADCEVSPEWLLLLVSFFEIKKIHFIAAPVSFYKEKNIFEKFQSLDLMGMMGATGAGLQLGWMHSCNGANLAYSKALFDEINGFENINHLASGDDILLMQKTAARFPEKIGFLKNKKATVFTRAKPTIGSFIAQRLRWATKSGQYPERKTTLLLAVVFFICQAVLLSLLAALFMGGRWGVLFLALFSIKSISDYFFLREMATWFGRPGLMSAFWPSQWLHLLYITLIGWMGNIVKKYKWKGRNVR